MLGVFDGWFILLDYFMVVRLIVDVLISCLRFGF